MGGGGGDRAPSPWWRGGGGGGTTYRGLFQASPNLVLWYVECKWECVVASCRLTASPGLSQTV